MVLEQLFEANWIEKKPRYAFLLGFIYALIGLVSARLIFTKNPSLMAVAFTAIFLIPSLNKMLEIEEKQALQRKKFSLNRIYKDHKDIFEVYFFLFIGVFLTFALVAALLPLNTTQKIFDAQLQSSGIKGYATEITPGKAEFDFTFFRSILLNNLLVLAVVLALSLIYGAGAIIFITWNASVWGVVLGVLAKQSALSAGNILTVFFSLLWPILPHLLTEALSYFTAAIGGGIVGKAVLREKFLSKRFNNVVLDSLVIVAIGFILVLIAAAAEASL